MSSRGWTLVLLVYVSLDLSSPFIPGAFNFDPDDCVDGLHRQANGPIRVDEAPAGAQARVPVALEIGPGRAVVERPHAPRLVRSDWLIDLRRAHPPSREVASPSEDH